MVAIKTTPLYEQDRRDSQRLWRARFFALAAHTAVGQIRKYTHEPYIVHPDEVAEIVATVPHITEMIEASYLHDVMEDTQVSELVIRECFGPLVANYVSGLTNIAKPADGSRNQRFEINLLHLEKQCSEVQTIKCADIISNTRNVAEYDPHFAVVYLREKTIALGRLVKADETLRHRGYEVVNAAIDRLAGRLHETT